MEPWKLSKAEWNRQRESLRPNTAQSRPTKNDASVAIRRAQEVDRLCFGLSFPDRRVTWRDVVQKSEAMGLK